LLRQTEPTPNPRCFVTRERNHHRHCGVLGPKQNGFVCFNFFLLYIKFIIFLHFVYSSTISLHLTVDLGFAHHQCLYSCYCLPDSTHSSPAKRPWTSKKPGRLPTVADVQAPAAATVLLNLPHFR